MSGKNEGAGDVGENRFDQGPDAIKENFETTVDIGFGCFVS